MIYKFFRGLVNYENSPSDAVCEGRLSQRSHINKEKGVGGIRSACVFR